MYNETNYIMWYDTVWGLSNTSAKEKLLDYFGSAEEIYKAGSSAIAKSGIVTEHYVSKLAEGKRKCDISQLINSLYDKGVKYYSRFDEGFPQRLKEMHTDMPMGIYVKGDFPLCEGYVSIVGARKCTEYGAYCAKKFAKELAQSGVCVISGMAMGIDSCAHKGCIDGGGKTVAVLGTGADICYPALNESLMGSICSNGCAVSEFPLGTHAAPYNFPYRNRLISALSDVLVVIESTEKSGTLITAEYAVEQNKEIFALPGNVTSKFSQGTNKLLKSPYVRCLTQTEDILSALNLEVKKMEENKNLIKNFENSLETDEKMVYDCIDSVPLTADEIAQKLGMDISRVSFAITMLELKGLVSKMAGQKYVR